MRTLLAEFGTKWIIESPALVAGFDACESRVMDHAHK